MRVGLLADTHDRVPAIRELVTALSSRGVTLLMHAGDYCSPFALDSIIESGLPLLGIFGRNDGDQEGLRQHAATGMGTELYESPHSFDLGGKQILLVHDLGEVHRRSVEAHEFVVHGFTHRVESIERGNALVINPGEACGWLTGKCTAAVLDLDTREIEQIEL